MRCATDLDSPAARGQSCRGPPTPTSHRETDNEQPIGSETEREANRRQDEVRRWVRKVDSVLDEPLLGERWDVKQGAERCDYGGEKGRIYRQTAQVVHVEDHGSSMSRTIGIFLDGVGVMDVNNQAGRCRLAI